MLYTLRRGFLIVALVAGAVAPLFASLTFHQIAGPEGPAYAVASIAGVVRGVDGVPMPNVSVAVYRRVIKDVRRVWASPPRLFVTDASGRYAADDLTPGEYVVAVHVVAMTMPRLAVHTLRAALLVAPGQADEERRLVLASGAGSPLPVLPHGPRGDIHTYQTTYAPDATTLDDADIVTVGAGERRDDVHVDVRPAVASVTVSGTIVDTSGPAATTMVRLISTHASERDIDYDGEVATSITDEHGRFVFLGVPPGDHELKVVRLSASTPESDDAFPPPGDLLRSWARRIVHVAETDVKLDPILLRRPITVSGRLVFGGFGAMVPAGVTRAAVWVAPVDSGLLSAPTPVAVDPTGHFTITGLMAGRYHVLGGGIIGWTVHSVTAAGRDISSAAIALGDADVDDANIVLSSRATQTTGLVHDAGGAAVANVQVVVFPADYARWIADGMSVRAMRTTRTSMNGAFSVVALAPGRYLIAAFPDGDLDRWPDRRDIEAAAAQGTVVELAAGQRLSLSLTLRHRR